MLNIALLMSAAIFFLLEISFGSVDIPMADVWKTLLGNGESESWNVIVLESRLPRALAALLCGMALSVSGLMMQTLFRNPLAGPHILGVSSGASLGVALVVMGLQGVFLGLGVMSDLIIVLSAFLGAMGILMTLFLISMRVSEILTVLIFGILLGSISLAIVGILQYLSPESQLKAFLVWTLGSFDSVESAEVVLMAIAIIPFLLLLIFLVKGLNLLLTGEEYAVSMGLNIKKSRLLIMICAGGLTAIVTAFCGPIGFIGVIVPHFSRMLLKTFDHKKLIINTMLLGINIMMLADFIAHMPGTTYILPINSITSLMGIPFIFWMLLKRKMIQAI